MEKKKLTKEQMDQLSKEGKVNTEALESSIKNKQRYDHTQGISK